MWKLGSVAEAALVAVKCLTQAAHGVTDQAFVKLSGVRFQLTKPLQLFGALAGDLIDFFPAILPCVDESQKEAFEARPPVAILRREVRAAVERFQIRGQKHGH